MSLSLDRHNNETELDFFLRKIKRLEGDMKLLENELSNTKIRLKRAEDYEIKYEVTSKEVYALTVDNDSLLAEIRELKVIIDELRIDNEKLSAQSPRKERQRKQKIENSIAKSSQRQNEDENGCDDRELKQQVQRWKQKYHKLEKENQQKIKYLKEQFQSQNIKTHEKLTKDQDGKVESLKQDLAKYKKLYQQKAHMDDFVRQKTQRIKLQKDKQIARLNKINQTQYKDIETKAKQSAAQLIAIKNKYTSILNTELQKIHHAMDDQDQIFDTQINGLRKLIELKDNEIQQMLKLMKVHSQKHMSEREDLKQQISKYRKVLYNVQRQNQNQLYNMKERLTSIHADQIQNLSNQYRSNKLSLQQQINDLKQILRAKKEECDDQVAEAHRMIKQLQEKVDEKDNKISELLEKIENSDNQNMTEVKEISTSLAKIQTEKEEIVSGLNENIAFKNVQINKLTSTIQVKNIEIKNLYDDIAILKKQIAEVQKQLEAKWRQERKDKQNQRDLLREQNQNLQSEWKAKEREWKLKEKSYLNEKQKLQRQNLKVKLGRDDLQKVNVELTHHLKEVDNLYKNQIKKGHQASFDTNSIRRQLMHQIQKQQIDLELAKKQQIQDMKKKHQIQVDRLRFEVSNLQTALNTKTNEVQKLNTELKKLDSSADKVSKGKFAEYQQKLAALNSQIHLTQNLYNNFMQAKSRIKREAA